MRELLVTILMSVMPLFQLHAQEIRVLEVKALEQSLKARAAQVHDNNGDLCAVVEVAAPKLEGLAFDGSRHVGDVRYSDGVYTLFVPAGTKRLGFKHRDFMPGNIDFGMFGVSIEGGCVYSVGLQRMDVNAEYQYLVLNVTPSDALVELDGHVQQTFEGTMSAFVQVGTTHHYKVSAAGKLTEEGDVTVVSLESKTEVSVSLRDNGRRVRIVSVEGADIYVNDKAVGVGTWEGTFVPGTFKVEARRGGAIVSSEACTVLEDVQEVQEFALSVLYGSLNVTSVQPKVSVTLDGQDVGLTPLLRPHVLPGSHKLVARKDGYDESVKTVVVERNMVLDVSFDMMPDARTLREQRAAEEQAEKERAAAAAGQAGLERETRPQTESAAAKETEAGRSVDAFSFAGLSGGFAPGSGETSFGVMAGFVKRAGGYLKVRSNFDFTHSDASHASQDKVWESPDYWSGRLHVVGGILFHAFGPVYPYAGAGYGFRNIYGRTAAADSALVSDHSYSGVALEGGVMFHFGRVLCSFGLSGAAFKYADIDFCVGISF